MLGLEAGCCSDPASGCHLICGRVFKNAAGEDGGHHSTGHLRAVPWGAIAPVVTAIRVLESIVPDGGPLFDAAVHAFQNAPAASAAFIRPGSLRRRVEAFTAWASGSARRLGREHEVVPEDPHGAIGPARFRRTPAWHTARRPDHR